MDPDQREAIDRLLRIDLRDYVGRFGLYPLTRLFKDVAEDLAPHSRDAARLADALEDVLASMEGDL